MGKVRDFSNQKIGLLTVKKIDESKPRGDCKNVYWECECQCGNIISINSCNLNTMIKKQRKSSCGCYTGYIDLVGQKFGKLTVISPYDTQKEKKRWRCRCDCGTITIVYGSNLTRGHTQSCGCITDSIGETNISQLLTENNISFLKEYTFEDLISENYKKLRFDFAILDENHSVIRLIEFDGRQHSLDYTPWNSSESLEIRKKRDKIKDNYAINKNIPLVRIPYTKRDNITIDDLFQNDFLVEGKEL